MTLSATLTSQTIDKMVSHQNDVGTIRATFIFETGDGHAEQTITMANLNGFIEAFSANISSVTANPTVDISFTDANSAVLHDETGLADGTIHSKDASDFDKIPVDGNITLGVDPSADAGGSGQTLTIIVDVKVTRGKGGIGR